jgi:hypothetical protein
MGNTPLTTVKNAVHKKQTQRYTGAAEPVISHFSLSNTQYVSSYPHCMGKQVFKRQIVDFLPGLKFRDSTMRTAV